MSNYAIFPFGDVQPGSKIILYGAGLSGKNMYQQIKRTDYCTVICVVDKAYNEKNMYEIEVKDPECLFDMTGYDYIIITLMHDKPKNEVERYLINEIGIPENKIIVPRDNVINWEYCFEDRKDELTFANRFRDYLYKISPRELISSKRIDVAIRYNLFRDFVFGYENPDNLSLYRRYTLIRTGGVEQETVHSPIRKEGIDDYIESGRKLVKSIQENGFQKEGLVPINEKKEALDGLHRIAAAIVLGEDVYVHRFEGVNQQHVDFSFFRQNGFTWDDQIRVLRGYTEIYGGNIGCLVLYYPCYSLWEYIEKQAAKVFDIVGCVDYDFENNYVGFENIIREVYFDSACKNEMISRKLKLLMQEKLMIRFVLLTEGEEKKDNFYETLREFKLDIRERFWDLFSEVPIVLHSPDDKKEYLHLRNIFLSVNNIKWIRRKTCQKYRNKFIDLLNDLDRWLCESEIDKNEIIIVGSGAMEVFGLKEVSDVDLTIMPNYRSRFNGRETYIINETMEIVHQNYTRGSNMDVIMDEQIIQDDNYHFIFNGFKFLNLDLVRHKKMISGRDKDTTDVRSIDLFLKWDEVFDNKEFLRERVHEEMIRRKY